MVAGQTVIRGRHSAPRSEEFSVPLNGWRIPSPRGAAKIPINRCFISHFETSTMVRQTNRTQLDAEASVDRKILTNHYYATRRSSKQSPTTSSFYHAKDAARLAQKSEGRVVMSLSDLSAVRKRNPTKRRFLASLFQTRDRTGPNKKRQSKKKKKHDASSPRKFAMDQYREDVANTRNNEGINPVLGASSDALVDLSSDSSDDTSMGGLLLSLHNSGDSAEARQGDNNSLSTAEAAQLREPKVVSQSEADLMEKDIQDPVSSFFCWLFGCQEPTTRPIPSQRLKQPQLVVSHDGKDEPSQNQVSTEGAHPGQDIDDMGPAPSEEDDYDRDTPYQYEYDDRDTPYEDMERATPYYDEDDENNGEDGEDDYSGTEDDYSEEYSEY